MHRLRTLLFLGVLVTAAPGMALANDLKLEARLICGSNDKPEDIHGKPVDAELVTNLQRTFKWKNYFEITNEVALIGVNKSYDFKMSANCGSRVKNLGGSRVEVHCVRQGKEVSSEVHTLPPALPPKWLVIGGDDTNNTAWFIVLRSLDPKLADANNPGAKN